jgi:hypothetical protein
VLHTQTSHCRYDNILTIFSLSLVIVGGGGGVWARADVEAVGR